MPCFARRLKRVLRQICFIIYANPVKSQAKQSYQWGTVSWATMPCPELVAPKKWLCLAPVAVAPDVQGRRYGTRMMGMLTEWARLSKSTVVVLGGVSFYERAGFSAARAAQLTSPYPISHTMLAGERSSAPSETLVYPQSFSKLD